VPEHGYSFRDVDGDAPDDVARDELVDGLGLGVDGEEAQALEHPGAPFRARWGDGRTEASSHDRLGLSPINKAPNQTPRRSGEHQVFPRRDRRSW